MTVHETILLDILKEIKNQRARINDLWDVNDIAEFLRLSKSSVQSRVICRRDFPRCVRIPTGDTGLGGRRWIANEIRDWVLRHREPVKN